MAVESPGLRWLAGAALLSAVVGGLSYGQAKTNFERREQAFRALASEACLSHPPDFTVDEAHFYTAIHRLETDQRLCNYSLTGEINP